MKRAAFVDSSLKYVNMSHCKLHYVQPSTLLWLRSGAKHWQLDKFRHRSHMSRFKGSPVTCGKGCIKLG